MFSRKLLKAAWPRNGHADSVEVNSYKLKLRIIEIANPVKNALPIRVRLNSLPLKNKSLMNSASAWKKINVGLSRKNGNVRKPG